MSSTASTVVSPQNLRSAANQSSRLAGMDPRVPEQMIDELFSQFIWGRADVLKAMNCSAGLFNSTARSGLPYIQLTQKIREKHSAFLSELPPATRNGQFLYNPADVAAWLHDNLRSTVTTVLVPLTKFTGKPDIMRATFERLKYQRISSAYADDGSGHRSLGQLCHWPEITALIKAEFADEVWAYPEDIATAADKQGRKTDKIELPAYEVKLPEGIIPVFFDALEVARTRKSESRTAGRSIIRNFAWARHEFPIGNEDPMADGLGKVLFTQGLFIGDTAAEIEDYDRGLLTIMTAERFVKLFGETALTNARWRLSRELTTWCGQRGYRFGPGLPAPELSKLLLVNKLRRNRKNRSCSAVPIHSQPT